MTRRSSRATPTFFLAWLLALLRIFGGAPVLWWLGAPSWAVAAWLMFHVRIDPSKLSSR
jgi:hypothetical protein